MTIVMIPTCWIIVAEGVEKEYRCIFNTPPTQIVRNKNQYIGLVIAFCFPLSNHSPFQIRNQDELDKMEGDVLRLWEQNNGTEGLILRKLYHKAWGLRVLPEVLVTEMLFT